MTAVTWAGHSFSPSPDRGAERFGLQKGKEAQIDGIHQAGWINPRREYDVDRAPVGVGLPFSEVIEHVISEGAGDTAVPGKDGFLIDAHRP